MDHKVCKDCGRRLDVFGICLNVNAAEAAIMAAPVYCGATSSFDAGAVTAALERVAAWRSEFRVPLKNGGSTAASAR